MSQTPEGDLLYRRANVLGAPAGEYVEGDVGLVVTRGTYDGTKRFSYFDTFGQEYDVNDNYARVDDPAIDVSRPKSIQANGTNSANIVEAGEWVASSAVAQSITIPLKVAGWTDRQGKVWKENSLINLTAPSIMVYKPYQFLIRSVQFIQNETQTYTVLGLTIPSAYSGKLPEAYPWD
jgi:prophage tail gpP-like protein